MPPRALPVPRPSVTEWLSFWQLPRPTSNTTSIEDYARGYGIILPVVAYNATRDKESPHDLTDQRPLKPPSSELTGPQFVKLARPIHARSARPEEHNLPW